MNVSFGILPNGSTAPGSTNPIQQINIFVNGSATPQLYDTLPLVNGTATFSGNRHQAAQPPVHVRDRHDRPEPPVGPRRASTFNVTTGTDRPPGVPEQPADVRRTTR